MTVVSLYVSVNWVKSMCSGHIYHNFSCCDDLSKFSKEYLNSLKCEFCTFFSIKFRKFWHTARLSRTNRHEVIKSENSLVFWATLYIATLWTVCWYKFQIFCSTFDGLHLRKVANVLQDSYWHCLHGMPGGGSMYWYGVCLSVCPNMGGGALTVWSSATGLQ